MGGGISGYLQNSLVAISNADAEPVCDQAVIYPTVHTDSAQSGLFLAGLLCSKVALNPGGSCALSIAGGAVRDA